MQCTFPRGNGDVLQNFAPNVRHYLALDNFIWNGSWLWLIFRSHPRKVEDEGRWDRRLFGFLGNKAASIRGEKDYLGSPLDDISARFNQSRYYSILMTWRSLARKLDGSCERTPLLIEMSGPTGDYSMQPTQVNNFNRRSESCKKEQRKIGYRGNGLRFELTLCF